MEILGIDIGGSGIKGAPVEVQTGDFTRDSEKRASAHARKVHDWGWHKWAGKLEEYLRRLEDLLWPSLIIVGGGVSKHAEHFLPHLKDVRATVVAAELRNDAGIVGAAMAAAPRGPVG